MLWMQSSSRSQVDVAVVVCWQHGASVSHVVVNLHLPCGYKHGLMQKTQCDCTQEALRFFLIMYHTQMNTNLSTMLQAIDLQIHSSTLNHMREIALRRTKRAYWSRSATILHLLCYS